MSTVYVVPDVQVRPGDVVDHLDWIAKDIVRRKPDHLVVLGDWWDLPSLNSHEPPGSLAKENARLREDLDAGHAAMERLVGPIRREQERIARRRIAKWRLKMEFLEGNHENRADRLAAADPRLEGVVGARLCEVERFGFRRHRFLEPHEIDGVQFAHYWQSAHSHRPIGGTVDNRLNKLCTSFVCGHEQGLRYGNRPLPTGRTIHGIVAGSCLTPDHRVLTADLRYVELGSVSVGDRLVSFDEFPGYGGRSRRFWPGTVQAMKIEDDEVFEVTLSTGKVFKVTADHRWLVRSRGTTTAWLRTDQMIPAGKHPNGKTHVPVLFDEWERGATFDHGWLAGLYDGEGCLYARPTSGGTSMVLSLSQKRGAVLDEAIRVHRDLFGLDAVAYEAQARDVAALRILGGRANVARVLGTLRPVRLLEKFNPEMLGRMTVHRWASVESIRPLGRRPVVRIAIDAKTMVVEGYAHHNCYLGVESYRGPQARNEWRGVAVLHDVRDGDFEPMFLTLRYLAREYAGEELVPYLRKRYPDRDWSHLE